MPEPKKNIKLTRNPYIIFFPFLLFYIIIVIIFQTDSIWGDEVRYYSMAQNLLHGFYSPSAPNVDLANGPGYPLILAPLLALHIPIICIKLLNPVFYYFSIIFLFKTVERFTSYKKALLIGLFWACYYNTYEVMPLLYTETATVFLVSLSLFLLSKSFTNQSIKKTKRYILLSGFVLGYLALTKVMFGYVLLALLICCIVLWLRNRAVTNYRRAIIIILIAFLTVTPYLIYTYNLTGKVFYWASVSGNNLYWMTSPDESEYGSWLPDPSFDSLESYSSTDKDSVSIGGQLNLKNRENRIAGSDSLIKLSHQKDFEEINKYTGVERDEAFKKIALKNIRSHPAKYIKNCFSNMGRMLFNYPFSYTLQKPGTLFRFPLSMVMLGLTIFSLIPTFMNWKNIPFLIKLCLLFSVIYLGGSVLACAETRMFTMIVPVLLLWIAFILSKTIRVNIKFFKTNK